MRTGGRHRVPALADPVHHPGRIVTRGIASRLAEPQPRGVRTRVGRPQVGGARGSDGTVDRYFQLLARRVEARDEEGDVWIARRRSLRALRDPDPPITDLLVTGSTNAPRPRCASPPASGPPFDTLPSLPTPPSHLTSTAKRLRLHRQRPERRRGRRASTGEVGEQQPTRRSSNPSLKAGTQSTGSSV